MEDPSGGERGASFALFRRMLGSLSSAEIGDLLRTEVVARLGCRAEGRTYVVPVTYAYDGDALFIQSADGLKVRMMHHRRGDARPPRQRSRVDLPHPPL